MIPEMMEEVMPSAEVTRREKSRPNLSSKVLLTSAILTSSMTCCGVLIRIRLTTFLPSP